MNAKINMNVDEALLLADGAHTGFTGHLEALQVLAAEVRRQRREIEALHRQIADTWPGVPDDEVLK